MIIPYPKGAVPLRTQETKVAQEKDKLKPTIAQMIAERNAEAKARKQSEKDGTKWFQKRRFLRASSIDVVAATLGSS